MRGIAAAAVRGGMVLRSGIVVALAIVGCAGERGGSVTPAVVAPSGGSATPAPAPTGCLPADRHGQRHDRRGEWTLYVDVSGDAWILEHEGPRVLDGDQAVLDLRSRVDSVRMVGGAVHGFGVGMCRGEETASRCAGGEFAPTPIACSRAPDLGACMVAFALNGTDPFIVADRLDSILGALDDEYCYGVVVKERPPAMPL